MSHSYEPRFQSGPYTGEWAARRGVSTDALDPSEVIDSTPRVRHRARRIVSGLIRENIDACGDRARISLPTYPAKRLLLKGTAYRHTAEALNALYEDQIAGAPRTEKIFSVGFGPDGYIPWEGETASEAQSWLKPQLAAAVDFRARPVVEAATTKTRVIAAWRAANDAGAEEVDIGIAFGTDGRLAVDGASFGEVMNAVHDNRDRLDTRLTLGANCGSARGIDRAASELPGALQFAYANSVNADVRALAAIPQNGAHDHEQVSVSDAARLSRKHRFPIVSLCCGFCPKDVKILRATISEGRN